MPRWWWRSCGAPCRGPISSAAPDPACARRAFAPWWMPPAWRWSAWSKWLPTSPESMANTGNCWAAAAAVRPDLAILTDSPDFHLRVARKLHRQGIPVVYLVAPQAWAWRKGRVREMRRTIHRLLCIFPFEEEFFTRHGVRTTYIGHPLAGLVRPTLSREEFFRKHRLAPERPLISVLPGSRRGEAARHLPALLDAVQRIYREQAVNVVLPASATTGAAFFSERLGRSPIQVIEGESWDAMAHADLALAASGTVTVEAALLGTPMVTFYKVTAASWLAGKFLVDVPFYSMVNLIAGRAVVPELMQISDDRRESGREALRLLADDRSRAEMKAGLPKCGRSWPAAPPRRSAPRSPSGKFWKDKSLMFRNRTLAVLTAGARAPAPHRRRTAAPASTSSSTRSTPRSLRPPNPSPPRRACASCRWTTTSTSAAFELNNALNVSRVVDDKGKQIPASRNQQDFTVRLNFEQPLVEGAAGQHHFLLRRQTLRPGRFAGLRHQVRRHPPRLRFPDVSRALVPGERLHHRPVLRRSARHGADGLYRAGQRHR